MRIENQRWHNDVLSYYREIMFTTLVYPYHLVSNSVAWFIFENEEGELPPKKGYIAAKEINGKIVKYFIDEEYRDLMPLRVEDTEELWLKESSTKKSIILHSLKPREFKITPEKTFETTRQMIDEIAPFEHSNPDEWMLLKMIVTMTIVGKTYLGICSGSEFGKTGLFNLFHGLTQKSIVLSKIRTEGGVLININETGNMVFDEICEYDEKPKKLVGGFALKTTENSPTYVNGAIKAKGLKQVYNITQQSITFTYNLLNHYTKNPDDFFDKMFTNNMAMHSRILKMKFSGILLEGFRRDFDIPKVAEDNKMYYIRINKHILWLQDLRLHNKYNLRFGDKENIGRHGLIYDEIAWMIDLCSKNFQEYKKFVGVLDKAIQDYKDMVSENPMKNEQTQFHELKITEESIDTQEKFSAISNANSEVKAPFSSLDFIQTFPKHECSIDDFLNKYPEEEMNLLLKNGDIYEIDNKTLKVLE